MHIKGRGKVGRRGHIMYPSKDKKVKTFFKITDNVFNVLM
jgi:hypothetical protein